MQPLAVRILCVALIAVFGSVSSAAAVAIKRPDDSFAPRLDRIQGLLDYIHAAEKIKVKAGPTLWQAVEAIPVATNRSITPAQEADLRDWLYDFLVAFSASSNDSLAAQFYLREGVNNPAALQYMKKTLENWGIPRGDTPFDLFRAMHRAVLNAQDYEYRFGNVFLRHSTFEVFEMQGRYERYRSHPKDVVKAKFKLQKEVEAALRAGETRLFTDIAFVAEEPVERTASANSIYTPFFCRLVWDSEREMWRFVEVVYNSKRPNSFLFSAI